MEGYFIGGFLAGSVIMAIVAGIVLWWLFRRSESTKNTVPGRSGSRSTSSSSGTSKSKPSPEELRRAERKELYEQLRSEWFTLNGSDELNNRAGFEPYLEKIKANKSKLNPSEYEFLIQGAEARLAGIADEEAAAEAVKPKLAAFAALRQETDHEMLFAELHKIVLLDSADALISTDELEEFGEEVDVDWAASTYDTVLESHLRLLLANALNGTAADFQKVMDLWEELDDNGYYDEKDEEGREHFVRTRLATEWNAVIVRFKRELDWDDDLFTLEDLDSDEYPNLLQKAKDGDLFALRVVLLLLDDEDDDMEELILDQSKAVFQSEADTQSLALGFAPGAKFRSV